MDSPGHVVYRDSPDISIASVNDDGDERKCLKYANQLRMRLKLAYFKVRMNQTTTPLTDLKLPLRIATSSTSIETFSFLEVQSNRHMEARHTRSLPLSGNRSYTCPNSQLVSSQMEKANILRVHSSSEKYPLSISHKERRRRSTSSKRHKRRLNEGNDKKSHSGKRARRRTLSTDFIEATNSKSVVMVTPARKLTTLPSGRRISGSAVDYLSSEANNEVLSSPLKSALPSSAIKGTPGQLGAARSLLELGCM
ncbi:hypothetical protein V1511DRAFT_488729 [Dipodascopsis uninucleata]